jgi:hypothetical protein
VREELARRMRKRVRDDLNIDSGSVTLHTKCPQLLKRGEHCTAVPSHCNHVVYDARWINTCDDAQ